MRWVVGNYLPHGAVGNFGWRDEGVVIGDLTFVLQFQRQRCLALHLVEEGREPTLLKIQHVEAVGNLLEEHFWKFAGGI